MKFYSLLKMVGENRIPGWLKIWGLAALHGCGKRVVGVFIDPTMSCNLRCKMCYFSDEAKRREMHGTIADDFLDNVARSVFHRAMKLQIGCGAEPTLYGTEKLCALIEKGRNAGIPYISLTTNGQLIATGKVDLESLVAAGLNEITLSLHGTTREIYEELMPKASFDNFLRLVEILKRVKSTHPNFKLRVNYTVNSLNVNDLKDGKFWALWGDGFQPDIVQLRPVQKIGDSEWNDFDIEPLKRCFDDSIGAVVAEGRRRGVVVIAPTLAELDQVSSDQSGASAVIEDLSYCYVSPTSCYKPDFHPGCDTYESYHRRHHTGRRLLLAGFSPRSFIRSRKSTKKLNYKVK